MTYRPVQIGIPAAIAPDITYREFSPDTSCASVYCYWILETQQPLHEDCNYLVLPDGCIDIVFDLHPSTAETGALIMTPQTAAFNFNLGRVFRYAGVRLLPGSWQKTPVAMVGEITHCTALEGIDLEMIRQTMMDCSTQEILQTLEGFAVMLRQQGVIAPDAILQKLLNADDIQTIEDLARISGYSLRHIQRILRERVGYNPHDLLKIVRFQRSLRSGQHAYADQSHYIRECKRITGMTPGQLRKRYALMAEISNTTTA